MDTMVKLCDVAPEIEIKNGFVYLKHEGQHSFACTPHVARLISQRIKRALDEMDIANAGKVVAFR